MSARAILLAAAVALPVATGCGGDEDGDSSPPAKGEDTRAAEPRGPDADACELLTTDEIEARIPRAAAPDEKTGRTLDDFPLSQCAWEAGDSMVAVAVVGSSERYRMHKARGRGEPLDGLGDAALVETGTSLEDRGGSGGRTVFVLDGDRTLVVALDRGRQAEVTVDEVAELARSAHRRLP